MQCTLLAIFHAFSFPNSGHENRVTALWSYVQRKQVARKGCTAGLSMCLCTMCCYCITELDSLSTRNSLPTNDNNHSTCHAQFSTALKLFCWRGKIKAIISSLKIVSFGFHVHTNLVSGSDFSIILYLMCDYGLLSEMSSPRIRQGKIKLSVLGVKEITRSSSFSSDNIHLAFTTDICT